MFRSGFCRLLAAVWLCAPLAANAQDAASATPDPALMVPTAADFGAVPFLSNPLLSPDGLHIVAKGVIEGKEMVVIAEAGVPNPKIMRIPMPDKLQFESVRWAGNGRVLVDVSKTDHIEGEEVRLTRLVLIDIATSQASIAGPREQGIYGDDIVFLDRAGKFMLLSTQASIYDYPSVYRVDLDTGKSTVVVRPMDGVWSWFADPTGVVRAGIETQDGKWWLRYRPGATGDFKRVLNGNAADDKNVQQFAAVLGSDQGFAIADGKTGHLALYRYDFTAGKLGDILYENPGYDIDDFSLSSDGQVRAVYYTDDRAEIAWFDPAMKTLQARIDHALPGRINRITSFSDDRSRALVWSGSSEDPGAYLLYDRAHNTMDTFIQPYEKMVGKRLAAMEPVHYNARDGLEIPGYLTLPPGRGDKNLPLVVMPHGGPYARDEWSYDAWVQYLASKGYAVLQPNFRGSTGFGRKYVEAGTGAWGRGMQDDIDDGVKWLSARGTVDPKRVCIMGASFGGYAAEWAAVRNPELYRCAISFAGVSDVASQLRFSRKSFSAPRYFRDWRERVKGDKAFELDQISPLETVARMTVPILIAHGDADDTVPVSQSRRLHDALVKLGRAHEYVIYPGESHGLDDPAHATDFLNRVGAFLDKHNPATP